MAVVGAAPVTMETLRYFQSINIPLYELFGMSECSGPMTVSIPGNVVSGGCGIAMDGTEMKIINEDEDGNGEVSSNPAQVERGEGYQGQEVGEGGGGTKGNKVCRVKLMR